jgi:hypothetical protein
MGKASTDGPDCGRRALLELSPRGDRLQARFAGDWWREFHLPPGASQPDSLAENFSEAQSNKKNVIIFDICRYIRREEIFL